MALKTIKNKSNRKSNKVLEIRNGGAMCKTPNPRPIQKVWISKDFKMVNNNSSLSRILFVYLPGRETPLWRSTTAKIEQHSNFILKESPQQLWQRVKDWPRLWWVWSIATGYIFFYLVDKVVATFVQVKLLHTRFRH